MRICFVTYLSLISVFTFVCLHISTILSYADHVMVISCFSFYAWHYLLRAILCVYVCLAYCISDCLCFYIPHVSVEWEMAFLLWLKNW